MHLLLLKSKFLFFNSVKMRKNTPLQTGKKHQATLICSVKGWIESVGGVQLLLLSECWMPLRLLSLYLQGPWSCPRNVRRSW